MRDPHEADDVVQDTVVAALSTDSQARSRHRTRWMAAILRNVVHQRARARARRDRHEGDAPVRELPTSGADAAVELAVHRQLVGCVEQLDEPLRHVLFLHYWRGLTPNEIADQTDVPLKTVYGRLERGRRHLRARLDKSHNTRDSWRTTLAPLIGIVPARTPASTFPFLAVFMSSRWVIGPGVGLLSLGLLGWLAFPDARRDTEPGDTVATHLAALGSDGSAPREGDAQPLRTLVAAVEAPEDAVANAAPVVGQVWTLDSRPVGGVRVVCLESASAAGGAASIRANDDGSFALPHPGVETLVTVVDDEWATVCKAFVPARATDLDPVLVVVAPRRDYAGIVIGGDGQPVADANVVLGIDGETSPARAIGDRTVVLPDDLASTTTDRAGMFHLKSIGYVEGARVEVDHPQWQEASVPLPPFGTHDLQVRLSTDESVRIYGIVTDARGAHVCGATIAAGQASVRSFGDGRFALPVRSSGKADLLRAVHPQHGAAVLQVARTAGGIGSTPSRPIELQLDATRTITGRVTDPSGTPIAGARVWTPDVTYLGDVTREEDGHLVSDGTTLEAIASGQWAQSHIRTFCGDDGAFELSGLLARDYELFAMHPHTLATSGPTRVKADDTAELILDRAGVRRVAGRIVDTCGTPMAGVLVSPARYLAWERPKRRLDPWADALTGAWTATSSRHSRVTTGEDGRFVFESMAVDRTYLWCLSQEVYTESAFKLPAQGLEDLEIVLEARCSFAVHLLDPHEADDFFVERDGKDVRLTMRVESFEIATTYVKFVRGISPVTYTATGDVTIALRKNGEEVRRASVTLPRSPRHIVEL
ncbi:MAG: sigma-70 family RNA polymerase sigma factor [Planctomycetota bacterium]